LNTDGEKLVYLIEVSLLLEIAFTRFVDIR